MGVDSFEVSRIAGPHNFSRQQRGNAGNIVAMAAEHRFLRALLPSSWFEAVKRGTKEWLGECPDGHRWDFWDAGGVRYKGAGEPRKYMPCPECKKARWHKIRRKNAAEMSELP